MSSRFSALNFGYVAFAVTSSRFFISIPPLFICPPKRAPIHHRRQSGLLCAPPRQAQSCAASRCADLVMVLLLFQSRFLIPLINWLSPVWIIPFSSVFPGHADAYLSPAIIITGDTNDMHQRCLDYITSTVPLWADKCKFLTFLRFAQFLAGFLCI